MAAYMYPPADTFNPAMNNRRYQIREKIFSLGDDFKVKDAYGQDVFRVRSKLLSFGDNLVLEDMNGNPLIKIKQEVLHLHPTYNIVSAREGDAERQLGVVKKKFSFLHKKFEIHSAYGEYQLEGLDIFAHEFSLMKNGQTAAYVSKKLFSFSDTYGVEIYGNEDDAFILALIIVLDQVIYDKNND